MCARTSAGSPAGRAGEHSRSRACRCGRRCCGGDRENEIISDDEEHATYLIMATKADAVAMVV